MSLRVEAVDAEKDGAKLEGALAGDEEVGGDAVEVAIAALEDAQVQEDLDVLGDVGARDADAAGEFEDRQGLAFDCLLYTSPSPRDS